MRCIKALALLAALFVLSAILPIDCSDASSDNTVLITEINPSDEAVTIGNRGQSSVDLKGYTVTDGEGTLTFSSKTILSPGSEIILSKKSGTDWFNSRSNVITYPSTAITKTGSFILADSGDDVSLKNGDLLLDSVCYGNSSGVSGWTGEPICISSKQYLQRTGVSDTNCSDDWISTKPGWTNLEFQDNYSFQAEVTPFTFPESEGEPIISVLQNATSSVDISIYLLSSPKLVSVLCQLEDSGVEVRVLVEGSPLGTDISTEISLMKTLTDSGGEVRVINYSGSSETRFTYVHNKYAVIDGTYTIVTSENWTSGNIGGEGNRGWGAIIESKDYSAYMENIFENDFSEEWGDVKGFLEVYPESKPYSNLETVEPVTSSEESFTAYVTPALSPDNSFEALHTLMTQTSERLYSEQMDLGSSLTSTSGNTPVAWMASAASRGVDTKFILDSSQSDSSTHENYINLITSASSVEAICKDGGDGYSLIHNKGVILDDKVWLASVNWTETSFDHNRECAVVIDSEEVSDYFAGFFLKDFGINAFTLLDTGIDLTTELVSGTSGTFVIISAGGETDCEYTWTLPDGSEMTTGYGSILLKAETPGEYSVKVAIKELGLENTASYTVPEMQENTVGNIASWACLSAAGMFALGLAVAILRERSEQKRRRPGNRRKTRYAHRTNKRRPSHRSWR